MLREPWSDDLGGAIAYLSFFLSLPPGVLRDAVRVRVGAGEGGRGQHREPAVLVAADSAPVHTHPKLAAGHEDAVPGAAHAQHTQLHGRVRLLPEGLSGGKF